MMFLGSSHTYDFANHVTTDMEAMLGNKLMPRRVFLNGEERYFARVLECKTGDDGYVTELPVPPSIFDSSDQPTTSIVHLTGRVHVEPWAPLMLKWPWPLHETPELCLYFLIESLGSFLWVQRRAKSRGQMEGDVGVKDEKNAYLDQQLIVAILRLRDGFEFKDHAQYMNWYRWWSEWHRHQLSEDEWRKVDALLSEAFKSKPTEEMFASWRPPGSWK